MKLRRILVTLLAAALLLGMMPAALADAPRQSTKDYCEKSSDGKHRVDWRTAQEPTCTKVGYQSGVCALCGFQLRQEIPPTGHRFDGSIVEWIKEPTCTEPGKCQVFCANRGCEEYILQDVLALGHDWTEWETVIKPTCTKAGESVRYCRRCDVDQPGIIEALGHKYSSSVVLREPTCAMVGERQFKCERCGNTVTEAIPTVPHTFTEDWTVALEAGDWNAGVKTRKCAVCGQAEQQPFYLEGTILPEDRGDAMKGLQTALNDHGFDCGAADGIYGPKTRLAVETAEVAAGHPATGIGWTGLQAWLADGAVPAQQPTGGGTDYGWTPPATEDDNDASGRLAQARNKPPKNTEDPLRVTEQPVGGMIRYDESSPGYPTYRMDVAVAGGVPPYTYEWHYNLPTLTWSTGYLGAKFDAAAIAAVAGRYGGRAKTTGELLAEYIKRDKDKVIGTLVTPPDRVATPAGTVIGSVYRPSGAVALDFSQVVGEDQHYIMASSIGSYYCVITDSAGEKVVSNSAEVTYSLFISQQPHYANIRGKAGVDFSCVAAGGDGSPYEYEWRLPDGSVRKSSDGVLKDVSAVGEYVCVVACGGETVTSDRVKLFDNDPLTVECVKDTYSIGGKEKKAKIKMHVKGGIPPYQCQWATGEPGSAYVIDEYEANIIINEGWYPTPWETSEAGIYWFMVTDGDGDWQWDASNVVDISAEPLVITEQPQDCELGINNSWIHVYTTVANAEGGVGYYLYEKGKSRENGDQYAQYNSANADDPNRLTGRNIVSKPGQYYVHVQDSIGRSADTEVFTVKAYSGSGSSGGSNTGAQPGTTAKPRQLKIAKQPVGGNLSNTGSLYTLSITMAEGEGMMRYSLYRNGTLCTEIVKNPSESDRLSASYDTAIPGDYSFHVEDAKGNWADSNTVTVTSSTFRVVINKSGGFNDSTNSTAEKPVTLKAVPYSGTEPITYEWVLREDNNSNYRYVTQVGTGDTITVVRPGYYQVTATDKNGQTDRSGVSIYYAGNKPIVVQQPTLLTHEWYKSGVGNVNTPRLTCRAVIRRGNIDTSDDSLFSGMKYEWEVKKPGSGSWSPAGTGSTIELDGQAGATYRCRITNTLAGGNNEYVYTNEAQVFGIQVLRAEESMMSDKKHSHYHLEFKGGKGPYRVELRSYNPSWGGTDGAIQVKWVETPYDVAECDFWSLKPSSVSQDIAGNNTFFDYYYIITDSAGQSVSNRPY